MEKFSALFQPGNIGTLRLKNRLIMSAMGTPLVDGQGNPTEATVNFFRARARGGFGLITTLPAGVSADATPFYLCAIWDDKFISPWRELCNSVQEEGGKVCIQLMHFGMLIAFAGILQEGMPIKVPSITSWMTGDRPFEVVSEQDIYRYVDDFAQAACRAKAAGADAVELHACHGCLLGSFMSPVLNHRRDKYGGSTENRMRFTRHTVEQIKKRTGKEFPLIVKIDCNNDVEGGITIKEVLWQAATLEAAGADAINVSSGIDYWSSLGIPNYAYPEGPTVPLAAKIKQVVKVPVIAAGKIRPRLAERIAREGKIDFVSMARPTLTDPDLPRKLLSGRLGDIRPCVYCNNCIRTDWDREGYCAVNPFIGQEGALPLPKSKSPKKVMVVGGGIAGMHVATLLAERGHGVTLYEKDNELGGQWNIAAATPGKRDYAAFTEYLKRSLKKHRVKVKLETEVTAALVKKTKPDAVVVATGAISRTLNMPGVTKRHVVQANDVIMGKAKVKDRVAVIGGRFVGMEVAVLLAEQGKQVSIVTLGALGENGSKLERMIYRTLVRKLIKLHIPIYSHTAALEITGKSVIIGWQNEIFSLPADTVVLAVGAIPDNKLAQDLEGVVSELHRVGDCVSARDAAAAACHAAQVAMLI